MNPSVPSVILVGTGVVGRAILRAHTEAGVSLRVADQDAQSLAEAIGQLSLGKTQWNVSPIEPIADDLPSMTLRRVDDPNESGPSILIESIAEKLDIKRAFFEQATRRFGDRTVLCSNTSTLRIGQIGQGLDCHERICGMHFFMPVTGRPAVEVVRGDASDESAIDACAQHVRKIGKRPLIVRDSPGFIVNRLLSPYLNEAMLLLCRGVPAEQLERAALRYGMPMSPLELIDWIGTRTMFDAGRAFWQVFPGRFDPAPMLGALIKAKRTGRAGGAGLYDYIDDRRSKDPSSITIQLAEKYQRNEVSLADEEVMLLLAIPMWIEAVFAWREEVVSAIDQFDLAVQGGLGYQFDGGWLAFFDGIGSQRMLKAFEEHASTSKALNVPPELLDLLRVQSPTESLAAFAS